MKIPVTFKDPDALSDAIDDAVRKDVAQIFGLNEAEQEAVFRVRRERVQKQVGKWFRDGEYVELEVDTEAGIAVVVKP